MSTLFLGVVGANCLDADDTPLTSKGPNRTDCTAGVVVGGESMPSVLHKSVKQRQ